MRRTVPLLLAALALALPSAALAQSAGDEQYADPFGEVEQPNGGQDQQAQAPGDTAPAPAEPAQTAPAEESVAAQDTAEATLPRTGPGLPAWYIAINGAVLLLAGTALRRGFS
ncbi:MAG TPA: hypothetical protein VJT68_07905 [Thermoleophilaceae bacterium]|nr:hypothetical protein [Thermoleophilaceae bacterium]